MQDKIKKRSFGFTIAELLIVISVIAILAAVVYVSYDNWASSTTNSQLKSDLANAGTAMENYRTFNNLYPTTVPTTFTSSSGVTMTGGSSDGGLTYCLNATSTKITTAKYFLVSSGQPTSGFCSLIGSVGVVSQGAVSVAVTPAWGTSESRIAGHLLVCWVAVAGSATIPTTPSGWTSAVSLAGTTSSVAIFYKIAAGSDTAPTIALITNGYISARLAEFDLGSSTPSLDKVGSVAGLTTPKLATASGVNTYSSGQLIVTASTIYCSMANTQIFADTVNNAVSIAVNNATVSTRNHYDFSYGYSTAKASADSNSFSFIDTSISGVATVIASFKY